VSAATIPANPVAGTRNSAAVAVVIGGPVGGTEAVSIIMEEG